MKFKITWTSGAVETCEQESANTVGEFINIHFGSAFDPDSGTTVELVEEPVEDETPEEKAAKDAAADALIKTANAEAALDAAAGAFKTGLQG